MATVVCVREKSDKRSTCANHRRDSRMWDDKEWFYYDMPYGGRRIWGVTAGIIRTLYERLYT